MAPILRLNKIKKSFYKKRSFFKTDEIKAVNNVSFTVDEGSIYGLVGESGCGKTTTAHPYTQALISAIPSIKNRSSKERIILEGEIPSPINMPIGCPFLKRCRYSKKICSKERPELISIGSHQREVACHLYT